MQRMHREGNRHGAPPIARGRGGLFAQGRGVRFNGHWGEIPRHPSLRPRGASAVRSTISEACSVAAGLRREAEMDHVAVGHDVILALEAKLAGLARAGLAAERHVIRVCDHFGADETASPSAPR